MNNRELIAADIQETLEATRQSSTATVRLGRITRDPIVIDELSRESFPCVFVESANEQREDISIGSRQGTIEYQLNLHVHGDTRDSQRNALIELIEQALSTDITRGGAAYDTQLSSIEIIESGEAKPYASIRLTFVIRYCY